MKLRQKNVCQTCREHKIGCDGKRPSCSQCRHTGRACAGYPSHFEFIVTNRNGRKRPRHKQRHQNSQDLRLTRTLAPAVQDAANLIIRSYVPENEIAWLGQVQDAQPRVCGGWVATLPELLAFSSSSQILPAAVKTLALAIASKYPAQRPTNPTIWQSYGSTVRILQQSLGNRVGVCNGQYLASLMCLTLTELIISTRKDDWMVHIDGISAMFQHLGPTFFSQGVPHRLFIGFRPLLVFKAIISRNSSFLSHEQWKVSPFQNIPASPMQQLLSEAISVPSVLQRFDLLQSRTSPLVNESKALKNALKTTLHRLLAWEEGYKSTLMQPLYWALTVGIPDCQQTCLWFRDVTVANALTHYWALTAICFIHIQELRLVTEDHVIDDTQRQQYLEPITKICQSIPYLFQENLKLYGPSSAAFLLSTVRDISRWDQQHGGAEITLHRDIVNFAIYHGFCFNS